MKAGIIPAENIIHTSKQLCEKVHSEVASMTDTTAIQELMSRVSAENKLFENNIPTLKQTVNDMANENKTQGFEFGAIAASLSMKDSDVKDVMARISELATIESKYKESMVAQRCSDRHCRQGGNHPEFAERALCCNIETLGL